MCYLFSIVLIQAICDHSKYRSNLGLRKKIGSVAAATVDNTQSRVRHRQLIIWFCVVLGRLKYQIQHLMVARNVFVHGVGGAKMDANLVVDALHYAQKCDAVLRELG